MVTKTFGCTKEGDKIYRVRVRNSKVQENSDGSIINDLKVIKIESLGDFYNFEFELSDGSQIRVGRNSEVSYISTATTFKLGEVTGVTGDFYSHDRAKLLKTVSEHLKNNAKTVGEIKEQALKISNLCNVSISIIDSLIDTIPEEKEMTEEEFAEMALC